MESQTTPETGEDLAAFLLARLDEDEQAARAAYYEGQRWITEEEGVYRWPDDEAVHTADRKCDAAHIARHDPARVLADVEAKRRIVALHDPDRQREPDEPEHVCSPVGPCLTLRLLALPYAEHEDYRQEWAP